MDDDRSSISIPEDIVAEILVRLQIGPLFRFKIVSKRWNSIISDPEFGTNYLQRLRSSPKSSSSGHLCALLKTNISRDLSSSVYSLLGTDQDPPPSLHISTFSRRKVNEETQILGSSSGLILSHDDCLASKAWRRSYDFSVSNPLTKQSVLLPPLNVNLKAFGDNPWAFGFATHNYPTYLTYKVVAILRERSTSTIMVFSSDKGHWTCEKPIFGCPEVPFGEDRAFSCKGVLHWIHLKSRSIVTYDPYDAPDRFGHIQFPIGSHNVLSIPFLHLNQFGHEEMLKYMDIDYCVKDVERELRVWGYDKGEWCLEQKSLISPRVSDSFLFDRRWVGPDPCNDTFFSYFWGKAIDRRHGADRKERKPFDGGYNLVPIALCPWSSPFYVGVKCNSSSIVGFRKISTVRLGYLFDQVKNKFGCIVIY